MDPFWQYLLGIWVSMLALRFVMRPFRPVFEFISNIFFLVTILFVIVALICLMDPKCNH
jgi:hypothetical protein